MKSKDLGVGDWMHVVDWAQEELDDLEARGEGGR